MFRMLAYGLLWANKLSRQKYEQYISERELSVPIRHSSKYCQQSVCARIAQLVEHCTYEVNWPCKGLEFDSRYGHILAFQSKISVSAYFFFNS